MAISQHTGTNDIWIVRLVSKLFYVLSSKNKKILHLLLMI